MDWRELLSAGFRVLDRMMDREKMQRDIDTAFARIRELEDKVAVLERGIGDADAPTLRSP